MKSVHIHKKDEVVLDNVNIIAGIGEQAFWSYMGGPKIFFQGGAGGGQGIFLLLISPFQVQNWCWPQPENFFFPELIFQTNKKKPVANLKSSNSG